MVVDIPAKMMKDLPRKPTVISCADCGATVVRKPRGGHKRVRCRSCARADTLRKQVKKRAWVTALVNRYKRLKGCHFCGRTWGLDFHHPDPSEKEGNIGLMLGRSQKVWRREVRKCWVVCASCHRALHHPELEPTWPYHSAQEA
jgi:hypothetical protein